MNAQWTSIVNAVADEYPGYGSLSEQLVLLLSSLPPELILLDDSPSPRLTDAVVNSTLRALSLYTGICSIHLITINAISCFTPRILYDKVLNSLSSTHPRWQEGSLNWLGNGSTALRFNESFDSFLVGLKKNWQELRQSDRKADRQPHLILYIKQAHRLSEKLVNIMLPLATLRSSIGIPFTLIMRKSQRWPTLKDRTHVSEPYLLPSPTLTRTALLPFLVSICSPPLPLQATLAAASHELPSRLDPIQINLVHSKFLETLIAICHTFSHDPRDLAFVAGIQWPVILKTLMKESSQCSSSPAAGQLSPTKSLTSTPWYRALTKMHSLLSARFEHLHPRLTSTVVPKMTPVVQNVMGRLDVFPFSESHIWTLLAAFLASHNPSRTDLQKFFRSSEERKKKKGGGTRRTRVTKHTQPSPQLVGPVAFNFDRMQAILGSLLAECDDSDSAPDVALESVTMYNAFYDLMRWGLIETVTISIKPGLTMALRCGVCLTDLMTKEFTTRCDLITYLHEYQ